MYVALRFSDFVMIRRRKTGLFSDQSCEQALAVVDVLALRGFRFRMAEQVGNDIQRDPLLPPFRGTGVTEIVG